MDSKERFTSRAGNYAKYRPGYPSAAVDCLMKACGLAPGMAIADIGAFHWFDKAKFREECRRILKPGGKAALVWNRRDSTDPFMAGYENVRESIYSDIGKKAMNGVDEAAYASFYAKHEIYKFVSGQSLDYEGLVGRTLSSSSAPRPGHPQYGPLLRALRELFERYEKNGQVSFVYQTEVVVGEV